MVRWCVLFFAHFFFIDISLYSFRRDEGNFENWKFHFQLVFFEKKLFYQLKVISDKNINLRNNVSEKITLLRKLHFWEIHLIKQIQKPRWLTSQSMQVFLATVLHLYQVIGKTVPPGESQVMNNKDWGYVLWCELQTHRQALTFINIIHVPFNKLEAI